MPCAGLARSANPYYAKLVLSDDPSKVIHLMFDERGGTGTGYDLLYGDFNCNGKLDDEAPCSGRVLGEGISFFGPIDFRPSFKSLTMAPGKKTQVALYTMISRGVAAATLMANIALRDSKGIWEYSIRCELNLAKSWNDAIPSSLAQGSSGLAIEVRPDKAKKGFTGIAVTLKKGNMEYQCRKDAVPAVAYVRVKDARGKVIFAENPASNKLAFG
jgi:hypothetical protein